MKLTKGDIKKIQEELDYLKQVESPAIKERLKEARAQGDLSENYEYTTAKRENNRINSRIHYLESMLVNPDIEETDEASDVVGINKEVTVYMPSFETENVFKIVSAIRADVLENRISTDAPLAKALLGHKVGDTVHVVIDEKRSYDAEIRKVVPIPDDGSDPLRKF